VGARTGITVGAAVIICSWPARGRWGRYACWPVILPCFHQFHCLGLYCVPPRFLMIVGCGRMRAEAVCTLGGRPRGRRTTASPSPTTSCCTELMRDWFLGGRPTGRALASLRQSSGAKNSVFCGFSRFERHSGTSGSSWASIGRTKDILALGVAWRSQGDAWPFHN
jgi:hypothetical protein